MKEQDQTTLDKLAHEWKRIPLINHAAGIVLDIQVSPTHYSFRPENEGSWYLDTFVGFGNPITSIQVLSQMPGFSDARNQYTLRTVFVNTSDYITAFTESPQISLIRTHISEDDSPRITEFALRTKQVLFKKTLEPIPSQFEDQDSKVRQIIRQLRKVKASPDTTTIEASLKDGRRGLIELLPEYQASTPSR